MLLTLFICSLNKTFLSQGWKLKTRLMFWSWLRGWGMPQPSVWVRSMCVFVDVCTSVQLHEDNGWGVSWRCTFLTPPSSFFGPVCFESGRLFWPSVLASSVSWRMQRECPAHNPSSVCIWRTDGKQLVSYSYIYISANSPVMNHRKIGYGWVMIRPIAFHSLHAEQPGSSTRGCRQEEMQGRGRNWVETDWHRSERQSILSAENVTYIYLCVCIPAFTPA